MVRAGTCGPANLQPRRAEAAQRDEARAGRGVALLAGEVCGPPQFRSPPRLEFKARCARAVEVSFLIRKEPSPWTCWVGFRRALAPRFPSKKTVAKGGAETHLRKKRPD